MEKVEEKKEPSRGRGVLLPAWVLWTILGAIPTIFGLLTASYESRISDKTKINDSLQVKYDHVNRDYKQVLLKWNEVSKEKDDSYNRLLMQQKEDGYRRIDSLMQTIYSLQYDIYENKRLLLDNKRLLDKKLK